VQWEVLHGFDYKFYDLFSGDRIFKTGQGLTKIRLLCKRKSLSGYFFESPGT